MLLNMQFAYAYVIKVRWKKETTPIKSEPSLARPFLALIMLLSFHLTIFEFNKFNLSKSPAFF